MTPSMLSLWPLSTTYPASLAQDDHEAGRSFHHRSHFSGVSSISAS
jgi:hypothetical protein